MNIVKTLQKEIEKGKDTVMDDGTVVSKEEIKKVAMKNYLAGVKSGEIATDKSFEDYLADTADSYLNVQEVIDFVKGTDEAED